MIATDTRLNNFDFLRLSAAILVLFSHCYPLAGRSADEPVLNFLGYETGGGVAVAVFFTISGYLIAASWLRGRSALDYLTKRVMRIFPGLAVAVLLSIVLGALLTPLKLRDYLSHELTFNYLSNIWLHIHYHLPQVFAENPHPHAINGSLWTLPIEFFLYIMVLLLGICNVLRPWPMLGLTLLGLLMLSGIRHVPALADITVFNAAPLKLTLRMGCFFFLGACCYLFRQHIAYRLPTAALLLLGLLLTKGTVLGFYFYMLALPYLVFYFAQLDTPRLRATSRHGDLSYGIYIYAFPVQQLIMHLHGPGLSIGTFFVLALLPTLMLAHLSWRCIEAPALAWARSPRIPSWIQRLMPKRAQP